MAGLYPWSSVIVLFVLLLTVVNSVPTAGSRKHDGLISDEEQLDGYILNSPEDIDEQSDTSSNDYDFMNNLTPYSWEPKDKYEESDIMKDVKTDSKITPSVQDVKTWPEAKKNLTEMAKTQNVSDVARSLIEADLDELLVSNDMIPEIDLDSIKHMSGNETMPRFGCYGGEICAECVSYAFLPDGYPVCCYFCSFLPLLEQISFDEFVCTCPFF